MGGRRAGDDCRRGWVGYGRGRLGAHALHGASERWGQRRTARRLRVLARAMACFGLARLDMLRSARSEVPNWWPLRTRGCVVDCCTIDSSENGFDFYVKK